MLLQGGSRMYRAASLQAAGLVGGAGSGEGCSDGWRQIAVGRMTAVCREVKKFISCSGQWIQANHARLLPG
jgi:hypothetical protein